MQAVQAMVRVRCAMELKYFETVSKSFFQEKRATTFAEKVNAWDFSLI